MDEHNEDLLEVLDELRQQPFFRYYDMDMLNGCNFFPQSIDECDRSCELYPVDDGSVPDSIVSTDSEEYDFEVGTPLKYKYITPWNTVSLLLPTPSASSMGGCAGT